MKLKDKQKQISACIIAQDDRRVLRNAHYLEGNHPTLQSSRRIITFQPSSSLSTFSEGPNTTTVSTLSPGHHRLTNVLPLFQGYFYRHSNSW
jgi:hypothetical protein